MLSHLSERCPSQPIALRGVVFSVKPWTTVLLVTQRLLPALFVAALPNTASASPSIIAFPDYNVRPTGRMRVVHDFEDPNDHSWATMNNVTAFYRVRADQHVNDVLHPRVDVTTNSSQGYYGYAFYDPSVENHVSPLYSSCQRPSGPACRLDFHAIIHATESVLVGTVLRCAECTHIPRARPRYWAEHTLGSTSIQAPGRWKKHSILLGSHPVGFDISFLGYLENPGEFIALDDIELVDCEPEPSQLIPKECPEEMPYTCIDTQECLPLDRVCDQHADCLCEDDEWEDTCESIPPEGFLRLDSCSFESGNCTWYGSDLRPSVSIEKVSNKETGKSPGVHDRNVETLGQDTETKYQWENAQLPIPNNGYSLQPEDAPPWATKRDYLRVQMPPQSRADVAILRSLSFQPLFSSDGQCQIRFWHRNTATSDAVLKLELVELRHHVTQKPVRELWLSSTATTTPAPTASGLGGEQSAVNEYQVDPLHGSPAPYAGNEEWTRAVVDLNTAAVNFSYLLQFKVSSTDLETKGEIAVRNISMSEDCFHGVLSFMSCGRTGPFGPTQEDCDLFYEQKELVVVRESQTDPLRGVQSWKVPETMTYRIQALGAQGGEGVTRATDLRKTRGASVTAKVALNKGDYLLFLVGQLGESACEIPKGPEKLLPPFCPHFHTNVSVKGGGGGGGGATVVYRVRDNKMGVLLVAGGGGGLPFSSPDWFNVESSTIPYDLSTEGFGTVMTKAEAEEFLVGSVRGRGPCSMSVNNNITWAASGGFGRGGGACVAGGYGGGADVSTDHTDPEMPEVGRPGRSYTHDSVLFPSITPDIHAGSGFVEIMSVSNCACDYKCVWLGLLVDSPTCICPHGQRLGKKNTTCEDIVLTSSVQKTESHVLIPILIGVLIVVALTIGCSCLYLRRFGPRSRRPPNSMEKMSYLMCPCLSFPRRPLGLSAHILPQLQHPPTVMRVNPNYDIVDAKPAEQGLPEIPRKNIKLTGELGQGAFGQVYAGLVSNVPMVDGDMPVAVKTLPPVCTEQAESDFHMEAVIVSQFNHPNIVKFLGVCFNHHPHYIVLELLEGGDLKTFLRSCRPKQDQPSSLSVVDLLRLSLDVACGCLHLEEKRFIHRDIAARNCLLTTKGPNRKAKIADFGMARDIYRSDYYKKVGRAMLPVKWMPPEAFLDGVFTTKTDVWSFGILLWEVFSLGHMPYPGCSNEEVMTLVTQGGRLDPPDSCSLAVLSIMIACWSSEPDERPTFSTIISSLEKSLQSSRGLPVIYAPPTISAGGFRLHSSRPSPNSPFLGPGTTLGTGNSVVSDLTGACGDGLDRLSATSGDGYLTPLRRPQQHQQQYQVNSRGTNHRPFSSPGSTQYAVSSESSSTNCRPKGILSPSLYPSSSASASTVHESGASNSVSAGGSVFLDCVGFSNSTVPQSFNAKRAEKTRVFYKPRSVSLTNNNSVADPDPASQALLHSKEPDDKGCHHCSVVPSKRSGGCGQCQEKDENEEDECK